MDINCRQFKVITKIDDSDRPENEALSNVSSVVDTSSVVLTDLTQRLSILENKLDVMQSSSSQADSSDEQAINAQLFKMMHRAHKKKRH